MRKLQKNIKFEYFLGAILVLIVLIFVYERKRGFDEMDMNHRQSIEDMETEFGRIFLGQQLRIQSSVINTHGINYIITQKNEDRRLFEESVQRFKETLEALEALHPSKDHPLLEKIRKMQENKLSFIRGLTSLPPRERLKALGSPKLRQMNFELRSNLEKNISDERRRYLQEKNIVRVARSHMLKQLTTISSLLLLLTLLLSSILIYYAKRLRLKSQERLEAIIMRDEVLSVVSHDLKSPLSTISLNAHMALRNVKSSQDPEKLENYLFGVQRAVNVMLALIQDLLDMRKLDSGKLQLDLATEKLQDVVEEAEHLLAPLAESKEIVIINKLPRNPLLVNCDKKRILQILSNLLSNALKFTHHGGKVEVRAEELENNIQLTVVDTGPGIPEKDLPHLFDRFWQAKETAKQGTGLGLSIAQGLVHAHGGKIWVESKLNTGTAFHFTLPA